MADSCTPWARRIGDVPTQGLRPFDARWWKLFAFACREGKKRGIDVGLHNCPGYTSTGGPWVPSLLAMRELVFDVTNAAMQVSTRPNAIFPVYNEETKRYELPPCAARQTDIVEIGVARGGVRVAHIPMGAFVQPADWDSFGLECDKMNPEAVDLHLNHVIGELKRHLGDDLPGAGLRHILLDSYEAGTPTWTPRMREEFKARRGYDPLEFLPILGGREELYTAEEIARFKADFKRTVEDLYRDVLFKRMHERLRAEGVAFSCEPYANPWTPGPFVAAEVSPYIDRIMTEFWYDPAGKAIAPCGYNRLTGPGGRRHNIVEAEAFTGSPEVCEWTEMPSNLKPSADAAFLSGINRLIFHTCPLQPWDDSVKPGVTTGRWGTHFGRTQTWAENGACWFEYLARCQALLQWGEPSEKRMTLPFANDQLARTDGRRTLHFVVVREDVTLAEVPTGIWFDPTTGRIGRLPRKLKTGMSGFYDPAAPCAAESVECTQWKKLTAFSPALGDRTKSPDASVRYFSGTQTYRTQFDRPTDALARAEIRFSDGADQIYTVRVNGRTVGCAWCEPWTVILPAEDLKSTDNELEIDVTNAWRNRLIGDEQEPSDCVFERAPIAGGSFLLRYPEWFEKGLVARSAKNRQCFCTWNYFTADSQLVPSGLIHPPELGWR